VQEGETQTGIYAEIGKFHKRSVDLGVGEQTVVGGCKGDLDVNRCERKGAQALLVADSGDNTVNDLALFADVRVGCRKAFVAIPARHLRNAVTIVGKLFTMIERRKGFSTRSCTFRVKTGLAYW
jgi:hypothetical protein